MRFLYRCFFWLLPFWYGLTMTLTRKRRYPEVSRYTRVEDIANAIDYGRQWRSDPLDGRVDVMMSPRKFQAHIDSNGEMGDCDDFAIYWATALLKSVLCDRAFIGTTWRGKPGKRGSGHALCVFQAHGAYWWADYNRPRICTQWGWASDEAERRGMVPTAAGLIEVSLRRSGEPRLHKRVRVKTF